jgi:phosphoglucomutase
VIVAHDTRFLGERMAALAAAALRAQGQRPLLAKGAVPTPVIARAIRRRRARAGLVFTASHNPPEYQGLKLLDASGGSLAPDQARRIESLLGVPGEVVAAPSARVRTSIWFRR